MRLALRFLLLPTVVYDDTQIIDAVPEDRPLFRNWDNSGMGVGQSIHDFVTDLKITVLTTTPSGALVQLERLPKTYLPEVHN